MLGTTRFGSTLLPALAPVSGLMTRLREWPTTSQHQARRNALVATTACAQRSAERKDVEDFLAARADHDTTVVTSVRHLAHG